MVLTKNVYIDFTNDLDQIENGLCSLGIEPLRWSIVGVDDGKLVLSVSYNCNDFS